MDANRLVVISGCSGGGKSTLLIELGRRGHATVEEPGRRIVKEELKGKGVPSTDIVSTPVAISQQTAPVLEAIQTRYSLQTDQEAKPFDISAQLGILRLPAFVAAAVAVGLWAVRSAVHQVHSPPSGETMSMNRTAKARRSLG